MNVFERLFGRRRKDKQQTQDYLAPYYYYYNYPSQTYQHNTGYYGGDSNTQPAMYPYQYPQPQVATKQVQMPTQSQQAYQYVPPAQPYVAPSVPDYYYYYAVDKAPTGIKGLDHHLQGGFRRGEIYLIAGEAGMGKTIFALQFLKTGAEQGEVGIYITVDEPSEDVKMGVREALGWDLERLESEGKLVFLDLRTHFRVYSKETGVSVDPRELAKAIIDQIKKCNAKRLVIDPIAPLIITSHHDVLWVREYLRELVFQLKKLKDVTTLMTSEIPTGEEKKISRFGVEEYLASGVIVLSLEEYYGHLMRVMFIRKMRWTPISPVKLVFEIKYNDGIVVLKKLDEYLSELQQQLRTRRFLS